MFTIYMGKPGVYGLQFDLKIRGGGASPGSATGGKFRPGIELIICTNQFHLPKNSREGLKLVSKMALKKWNTNFRLEKQDYLFRCSFAPGKFPLGQTEKSYSNYFPTSLPHSRF